MKIVGGPASLELAHKIGKLMDVSLIDGKNKRFPDGEFYFKLDEEVNGEELFVIQSLYPPIDKQMMELFFILYTVRDLGARSIKLFAPYLAYSRQDERYLQGECLSAGLVAETLERLGVDFLYTVDIHNQNVLNLYNVKTINLTASGELAKYFNKYDLKDPFIVSPDNERLAIERAKFAAENIDANYDYFEKKRNRYTGDITTQSKLINVKGRDVIIIDDIISTGRTAANATKMLIKQGARRVFVGVSHALLLGDAWKDLKEAGVKEVVGTDSVVNEFAKVSVAPILSRAINEKFEQRY